MEIFCFIIPITGQPDVILGKDYHSYYYGYYKLWFKFHLLLLYLDINMNNTD